ncbi:unnamed protein product [Pedinophyceae sp. YPF-701]|nr:unnamed protein product [Pedinophyceae sp. YPF-701]
MKNRARMKCDEVTAKFVDCSKVHFLSVAWQCRAELHAMNECMKQYTTDDTLEEFKRRWVAAGMPSDPKHDLWPEEKPEWVAYVRRREERDPPKKDGMSALKKQFYNA